MHDVNVTMNGNFKLYCCPHVNPNGFPLKRIVGNSKYFSRKRHIVLGRYCWNCSNRRVRTLTYKRPSSWVIIVNESALLVVYLLLYSFLSSLSKASSFSLFFFMFIQLSLFFNASVWFFYYNNNLFLILDSSAFNGITWFERNATNDNINSLAYNCRWMKTLKYIDNIK